MKDVSIIVPAYNAELYLTKCLSSLVKQTKKEIEIIVVNDGSTDRTEDVARKFETKYSEIVKVITQENKGQSVARNTGIKAAEGKYIGFVDCDDIASEKMFELLYNKAIEKDYDVVSCNANIVYPKKTITAGSGVMMSTAKLGKEEKEELLLNMYPVVWNKIYKREIFKNKDFLFEPGVWAEDVLFVYKLIPFINSISYVDDVLYQYIQRPNSLTYTYSDKLYDLNKILEILIKFYEEKKISDDYKDELEYIYVRYMLATFIKRLAKTKNKEKYNEGVKFAKKVVNEKYPNYKKNKYLKHGAKSFYMKNFNKFFTEIVYMTEKNKMN